jgi:hypothetical protein
VRDFSRKSDVVCSFTLAPDGAPAWARDTEALWNEVEKKENRGNSQLAHEWEVALPNDLDAAQREALAREFSQWLVDVYGVAVTTGIHNGGDRGNGKNDHMHVMMTTRAIDADGWDTHKLREFSTKPGVANPEVDRVREHIAELINDALESAGSDETVSHLSFKARGIDREPTKHLGPKAAAIERRERDAGDGSDRADINRAIIEERLAWQREEVPPQITAAAERELSARFDGWQPLLHHVQPGPKDDLEHDHAAPGADETGFHNHTSRMKAFQMRAMELYHNQTSETVKDGTSFLERVVRVGREALSAIERRDGRTAAKAIEEALDAAKEKTAEIRAADSPPEDSEGKSWAERMRSPADILRDKGGYGPGLGRSATPEDELDRLASQWAAHAQDAPDNPPQPPDTPDNPPHKPDTPEPDSPGHPAPDIDIEK